MRKLGFTAYGFIPNTREIVRCSIAVLDTGYTAYVREDGSNTPLPFRPTRFLTSGHVVNVATKVGEPVNMAQMSRDILPDHEWKTSVTLAELAGRKSFTNWDAKRIKAVKAALKVFYTNQPEETDIAA